ncbi:MAG: class I SAM-dependent methyltransferase [Clostridia bacterium]|nr:class I SAM-dependent methyltransferase [Clostridia bacterium]
MTETIIILGAGQFGRGAAGLLNQENMALLAFGDNNPALHRLTESERREKGFPANVPVLPVEKALSLKPDYIMTGVTDPLRSSQLKEQALELGYQGRFLMLSQLYRYFDIRSATLKRLAERIHGQGLQGNIAELGVFKGDTAWKLNALFPQQRLFLFDTFEGFDARDINEEKRKGCSFAAEGEFSDTSEQAVLDRLPFPDQAVIRRGYFPDTAAGLEQERFYLVSLDADLYAPILSGLIFFYPRLVPGGMILLHDYNNERFRGARQAVEEFETQYNRLCLVPLCDLHGSAVIVKA